ncbi:MAG: threonine synthase [Bacteroidota bacterium]
MRYTSTSSDKVSVSFKEAVLANLPSDGGLFFPAEIPQLSKEFIGSLADKSVAESAFHVLSHFCQPDLPESILQGIVERVFSFDLPLKKLSSDLFSLELFHGPTYAFKDIGAKFLAECIAYFNEVDSQKMPTTVLVATSGDTGGAVANGFYKIEGINVVILYPSGKVSVLQEKQLTTLGENITALEVDGDFDACQALVKAAFADADLNNKMRLSSANSINVARWIPQSLFYFQPFIRGLENPVFAVPSGNYGNLTSGLLPMKMGLPIRKFIAASNANDVVPRFLQSRQYSPQNTIPTYANAMDVSDPSNFSRMIKLYKERESLFEEVLPFSLHDDEILKEIENSFKKEDYLLCPHSVIAKKALESVEGNEKVFLSTAHYCKFQPVMEKALGRQLDVPSFANDLMQLPKKVISMNAEFETFKSFLMER